MPAHAKQEPKGKYWRIGATADYLGFDVKTLRGWIRTGRLATVSAGSELRTTRESVYAVERRMAEGRMG